MTRAWLLLTIPAAAAAFAGIVAVALHLSRSVRESVVAREPLAAATRLTFQAAGEFRLWVEGPQGFGALRGGALGGMAFALTAADGSPVPVHRTIGGTTVAGFSRVRRQWARFALPVPGAYVIAVRGAPAGGADRLALVVTRPVNATIVGHVLALVALGMLLVGALVASALVLAGRAPGPTT